MRMGMLIVGLALLAVTTVAAQTVNLPISRVVLFSSGVGYFEREGTVEGNATVELSFRVEQINDILKSLILQDLDGGTIAPVTYAPQDPLQRTLSAFAVNIADNPGMAELWDRLRGARVRVITDMTIEGVVFGAEEQYKAVGDQMMPFDVLNIMTIDGLVSIPLSQVTYFTLLDPKLDEDLRKALAAIDTARDVSKRPVTLSFMGEGGRAVRVGYLLETPVWKTSYRLVSDEDGLFLQGWAIVENTTDDDWQAVALTMVSGQPVSFIQDLYPPLYSPRVRVPPSVHAAARPRVWEGAMERMEEPAEAEADRVAMAPMAAPAPGMMPGMGSAGPAGPSGPRGERGPVGGARMRLAEAGVDAMAEAGRVGTLFRYAINQPVTIPRQRSAMIPIVNTRIEGEKLSVYSQAVDAKRPMNGLLLKNTTDLHLMAGAITVFDGGVYGGDALIEDIPAGDERLLTYAVDLTLEVEPQTKIRDAEFLSASMQRGIVTIKRRHHSEMIYNIKSTAQEDRVVLIEHPLRDGWELVEPEKADERTRSAYRFRVTVEAGKTAALKVVETRPISELVRITDRDIDQVRVLLQMPQVSPTLREALEAIVAMQTELATLAAQRAEKETRIREIEAEQERIRKNMAELDRASQLYRQYVDKFTEQEQEFEQLRGEIRDLRAAEDENRKAMQDFIMGLNVQ